MQHLLQEKPDAAKKRAMTNIGYFEGSEDSVPPSPQKLTVEAKSTGNRRVLSAMMTNTSLLEVQVSIMARILEGLMKTIQERDSQSAYLTNKIESMDESRQVNDNPPRQTHVLEAVTIPPRALMLVETPHFTLVQEQSSKNVIISTNIPTSTRTLQVTVDGSILANQL